MKTSLLAIIILVVFSVINANAINCEQWKQISNLSTDENYVKIPKQMFVQGSLGAITLFGNENAQEKYKTNLNINVFVEGIDELCRDYKNTKVDILLLLYPVLMGVNGESEADIEKQIQFSRQLSNY